MAHRSSAPAHRSSGVDPALEVWARRKWLALVVFAAVFGGVVSLGLSLPDLYRATATVLVERQQVSEAFVRQSVTAELETRIQTIREEVMSRARLSDLIVSLDLYPELRKKRPLDAIVERMRRDIQLDLKGVDPQSSGRTAMVAFELSYSGRDPQTVANVANALAGLYVDGNTKIREDQAVRTAEFLKGQLADAKKQLDAMELRSSEFKLSHMGELPQQVEANLASMERLNNQLRLNGENQLRVLERRDGLEKQVADAATPPPAVVPERSPETERLTKLRQQLDELRARFADEYPDVVRARTELDALEKQIAQRPAADRTAPPPDSRPRLKQALADVDLELRALKDDERVLRQTIAAYEQRVQNAPKRQQEIQELSRDYETTKERYDTLLKRYQEAQLAENLEQGQKAEQFRILDPAIPPREPAAPGRLRLLMLGFIFAIGLAGGAVLAAEKLNTAFHSIDDVRAFVSVPTLGRVPLILAAADVRRQRRRAALTAVSAVVGVILIVAGSHYVARGNEQIVRLMERGHV